VLPELRIKDKELMDTVEFKLIDVLLWVRISKTLKFSWKN